MGYIYKITNLVNNKVYVGQTSESIQQRWKEHLYEANYDKNRKYNSALHCAIRKYGPDNFNVSILEEVDNSLLNNREMYWIEQYNSFKLGYNMTLGGEGTRTLDYDKIIELWDSGFGITDISKTVECSGVQAREILKGYSNYSKKKSNKRGARIFAKTVMQYDVNGVLFATYPSATEASAATGVSISNILAVCRAEQKTAGGYQWRFEGEKPLVGINIGNEIPVKQFCIDGTLKSVFDSAADAERRLGYSASAIRNACSGKAKSSYGYLWRFFDDELNADDLNARIRVRDRRVIQYTLDGTYVMTFNNASEAADFMGVTYNAIYNACIGKNKSSCGFVWKFEQ